MEVLYINCTMCTHDLPETYTQPSACSHWALDVYIKQTTCAHGITVTYMYLNQKVLAMMVMIAVLVQLWHPQIQLGVLEVHMYMHVILIYTDVHDNIKQLHIQ